MAYFTATAGAVDFVSEGSTVYLSWNLIGMLFTIERSIGGGPWVQLSDTIQGSTAIDVINDTALASRGAGNEIVYRIKPTGSGVSWTLSNSLYLAGGIKIKVNGEWKTGTPWVKVGGEWKRAKKVCLKQNGSWLTAK